MTDTEITIACAELDGIKGPLYKRWLKEWDREGNDVWCETGFDCDGDLCPVPDYLHDANAAIALLEKFGGWQAFSDKDGAIVYLRLPGRDQAAGSSTAPTFCRAACEAVLRANGK